MFELFMYCGMIDSVAKLHLVGCCF